MSSRNARPPTQFSGSLWREAPALLLFLVGAAVFIYAVYLTLLDAGG